MSGLSPELRNLIDVARPACDPSSADRRRVRDLLGQAIASGASAAAVTGAGKGLLSKLLGLALLGGVAGLVALAGAPDHVVPLRPSAVAPFAALERTPVAEQPVITDPVETPAPAPAIPSATHSAQASAPGGSLADEVRILREAEAARRGGNPGGAMALLNEHAKRFPRGAMGAEREAARVLVLCDLGQVAAARAIGARFLKSNASSPLASRIRGSCAAPPK